MATPELEPVLELVAGLVLAPVVPAELEPLVELVTGSTSDPVHPSTSHSKRRSQHSLQVA